MNNFYQENKRPLWLIIITLILFALILYLLVIHPISLDMKQAQQQVANKQTELQALNNKQADLKQKMAKQKTDVKALLVKQQVPATKELPAYITKLERVEQAANTVIEHITFRDDQSFTISDIPEGEENIDKDKDEGTNQVNKRTPANDDTDVQQTDKKEQKQKIWTNIPDGLKTLTIAIDAKAENFDDLVTFIQGIEQLKRASLVTELTFNQSGEQVSDKKQDVIDFSMNVTTFYYPNDKGE